MEKLTHVQLVEKLRAEKGWILTGGEDVGLVPHTEPNIISAYSIGNTLWIEIPGRTFEVESDNIVLVTPRVIQVFKFYPRHYQRKAKDGGGWHDVMVEFAAVRLRNSKQQARRIARQKQNIE